MSFLEERIAEVIFEAAKVRTMRDQFEETEAMSAREQIAIGGWCDASDELENAIGRLAGAVKGQP
jgi:hypothetical protein